MAEFEQTYERNEPPRLKDERARGFFYDYNEVFEIGLSPYAGWVRMYLIRLANSQSVAFPSYNTIAQACCMSKSSVRRAIDELIQTGLLVKRQRKKPGSKEHDSNEYAVLDPRPLVSQKSSPSEGHQALCVPREHTYAHAEHSPMPSVNTPCGLTEHVTIHTCQYTADSYTDRQTDPAPTASAHSPQPSSLSVNPSSLLRSDKGRAEDAASIPDQAVAAHPKPALSPTDPSLVTDPRPDNPPSPRAATDALDPIQIVTDAFHRYIGLLGPSQFARLRFWLEETAMNPEVIVYALEVAAKQKQADKEPPRISYVEGILRNWHNSSLTTVAQVKEHEARLASTRLAWKRKSGVELTRQQGIDFMAEHNGRRDVKAATRAAPEKDEPLQAVRSAMLEVACAGKDPIEQVTPSKPKLPPSLAALHRRHEAAMTAKELRLGVT